MQTSPRASDGMQQHLNRPSFTTFSSCLECIGYDGAWLALGFSVIVFSPVFFLGAREIEKKKQMYMVYSG